MGLRVLLRVFAALLFAVGLVFALVVVTSPPVNPDLFLFGGLLAWVLSTFTT